MTLQDATGKCGDLVNCGSICRSRRCWDRSTRECVSCCNHLTQCSVAQIGVIVTSRTKPVHVRRHVTPRLYKPLPFLNTPLSSPDVWPAYMVAAVPIQKNSRDVDPVNTATTAAAPEALGHLRQHMAWMENVEE